MKGILGRKVGMTEVFTKEGKVIPVTVIEVQPNVVTQVKTSETDGYNAIQLGVCDKKEKNATKASIGHSKKANTTPKRFLKEVRDFEGSYNLGDTIDATLFSAGDIVDVTGTSKGKGTQGVIKRWGQKSGPSAHGSRYHRRPGSMGTMRPMRVFKGKNLPGHMGIDTVTVQNLEIVTVDLENNIILVKGNVPGPKKGLIVIKTSIKTPGKINATEELINYDTKEVIEEAVETTEEIVESAEENIVEEQVVEEPTEEPAETEETVEVTQE